MSGPGRRTDRSTAATRLLARQAVALVLAAAAGPALAGAEAPVPASAASPAEPAASSPLILDTRGFKQDATRHKCFQPAYPSAAAAMRAEGVTRLEYTISETGAVTQIAILHSAGDSPAHKLLDMAAVEDIATCPIKPGHDAKGQSVGSKGEMTFTWRLD